MNADTPEAGAHHTRLNKLLASGSNSDTFRNSFLLQSMYAKKEQVKALQSQLGVLRDRYKHVSILCS